MLVCLLNEDAFWMGGGRLMRRAGSMVSATLAHGFRIYSETASHLSIVNELVSLPASTLP